MDLAPLLGLYNFGSSPHPRLLHRLALFHLQMKYCCLCAILLLLPSMYTPFFGVHSAPFSHTFPFFFHKVLTHLQMFYYLGAASFSPLPSLFLSSLLLLSATSPSNEFFLICCFLQQLPLPMSSFSLAASSALLLPVLFSALYSTYLSGVLKPGAVMGTCHLGGEVCSGYFHYLTQNP